jgi:hypothetical protein
MTWENYFLSNAGQHFNQNQQSEQPPLTSKIEQKDHDIDIVYILQ